jgi:hypothetical protein
MKLFKEVYALHHQKAKDLLSKGTLQANPAIWLYINDLRTTMFMLEATSRICEKVYDEPCFTKMKEQYKAVEDALGALDFYAAFFKELEPKNTIPNTIKQYLAEKAAEKAMVLNQLLEKEGWLNGKRLEKMEQQLKSIDWRKEDKELKKIAEFYAKDVEKITEFAYSTKFTFAHIEEVHEVRRRIRWLSIYGQALAGVFQFNATETPPTDALSPYLTDAVKKSPFNIMPTTLAVATPILLNKNYFFSLSWMIAELSRYKDSGLGVEVLKEALQNTAFLKDVAAYAEAYKLLGKDQVTLDVLISKSQTVIKTYFDEGHLKHLLSV